MEYQLDTTGAEDIAQSLDAFTSGYVTAALWTLCNEDGDPCSNKLADLVPEALARCKADCEAFQAKAAEWIGDCEPMELERAGHDFLLTRNGEGAGFWDGGWPEAEAELTALAKSFGGHWLYVGDDGKVY